MRRLVIHHNIKEETMTFASFELLMFRQQDTVKCLLFIFCCIPHGFIFLFWLFR